MPDPLFTRIQLDDIFAGYDDAVLEGITDGDNSTAHVKELQDRNVRAGIRRGKYILDTDKLIIQAAWNAASERSATNTTQFIKDINDGQTSLELDIWLDSPITVGKVRRTSIRFLLPEDMEIMVAIREQHWKDAGAVHRSAVSARGIVVPLLKTYGNMEKAVTSGGMILTAPPKVTV